MDYNALEKEKLSIDDFDLEVYHEKGIISVIVDADQVLDSKCIPENAVRQRQYLEIFADFHIENGNLDLFYRVEDADEEYKFYRFPATKSEVQMIKEVIAEAIQDLYHMTLREFYDSGERAVKLLKQEETT